jgi:recombination protein RecR
LVCVVEDIGDVLAIENTNQYQGLYHVLGGVISPMQGIGPEELTCERLVDRVKQGEIKEIILALSATMEGDTTSFYLGKRLNPLGVKITSIARGIPVGGELEFTDEVTLGRSILTRINYSQE